VCQRINEAVREKSLELSGVRTTISLGAASGKISGPEESAVALIINKADENLLTAKRDGKDRCVIS
ncbi:MAG: GGDEF domain-containing protein, partial [Victivallales bacterium]|nr:GGDEF domain-containing protein [Victivallales bacterium]